MRLFRNRPVNGKEGARAEREAAEQRLAHATEYVIVPLHELRERNHVGDIITALIQRKVQRKAGGNEPGPVPR